MRAEDCETPSSCSSLPTGPRQIGPETEPPGPAAASPSAAVASFLEREIEQDYAGSYGFLSAADRLDAPSRAAWVAMHGELPRVLASRIGVATERGDHADVAVALDLEPQLGPVSGLVPARADATFVAVAEDGGWRVAFARTTLVPRYPSDAAAVPAVRDWVLARRRCQPAGEYTSGLIGAATRAGSLCRARGAVRVGTPRPLPDSALDQPFLAAFGSQVHEWARVVPVGAPRHMAVVVAPVGERWLVVGVLQASLERS
jgi:hypothetical protein